MPRTSSLDIFTIANAVFRPGAIGYARGNLSNRMFRYYNLSA